MGERKTRVSCVGDSITIGHLIKDKYDIYPMQLNILLGGQYEVNLDLGWNGAAVWHHSPLPYTATIRYDKALNWTTDVLIVCLGSNDTVNQINDLFKRQFIDDYLALLTELKKNSPTAKAFVCKIPPIFGTENATYAERVPEINKLITEVANRFGASVIDLNTPFVSREDLFFSDGLHPNEAGAGLIAETVCKAITK